MLLLADVDAMRKAIEQQTGGYTMVYDLATTPFLHKAELATDELSVYNAFNDLRAKLRGFRPHIVVVYLEMSEQRKTKAFKMVSRSTCNLQPP